MPGRRATPEQLSCSPARMSTAPPPDRRSVMLSFLLLSTAGDCRLPQRKAERPEGACEPLPVSALSCCPPPVLAAPLHAAVCSWTLPGSLPTQAFVRAAPPARTARPPCICTAHLFQVLFRFLFLREAFLNHPV